MIIMELAGVTRGLEMRAVVDKIVGYGEALNA